MKASHGFPQHIHGYLEGARLSLLNSGHLTGPALQSALKHGHGRRMDYYNDRLSMGHSRQPMIAVAAAMEAARANALAYHEAEDAVVAAGFQPDDLERAIVHGSLSYGREGNVSFGIPSFHSHMAGLLAKQRAAQCRRE